MCSAKACSPLSVQGHLAGENLQRAGAIGYRLWLKMSAKPTLVVHSRRTDEADGDSSFGARVVRLSRERTASACEGADAAARKSAATAACKGASGYITGAGTCAGVQDTTRES